MPKFGTHIIIAEEVFRLRKDLFKDHHMNAFRFGAIGPDVTLFMFDPALKNPSVKKGMNICLDVLKSLHDIKDKVDAIANRLSEPLDDIQDWLSGGLIPDISKTIEISVANLTAAVKLGLVTGLGSINFKNPIFQLIQNPILPWDFIKDPAWRQPTIIISGQDNYGFPFRMFGHPYTEDANWRRPEKVGDYSNWWWMDLLHYRKTATFARDILKNANGSVQTSYAKGYTTHVAGDISGHPFINSIVKGPFRNHAFRHMVLETLADTWLWGKHKQSDILDAKLNEQIEVNDSELRQITNLVLSSMRNVYTSKMVPELFKDGYPSDADFQGGYKLLLEYFRLSTTGSVKRPAAPPDTPMELINEIRTLLQNNFPGSPPGWNGNVTDFLVAMLSWFGNGLAFLTMVATLGPAVISRFLHIAPRWVIYFVNLGLFYIQSAIRTAICFVGWGYNGKEDFESFAFLEPLITSSSYSGDQNAFPYRTPPVKTPYYWLMDPQISSIVELQRTHPQAVTKSVKPDFMIDWKNNIMNLTAVDKLIKANTPYETRDLQRFMHLFPSGFGNSVDFSIKLLEGSLEIADFDLDGDRGYGYKGWEENPPFETYDLK